VLPDAPVSDAMVVPKNWSLTDQGVGKDCSNGKGMVPTPVMPTPILIAGRLLNIADDTENLQLVWYRDGRWKKHTVNRAVVATAKSPGKSRSLKKLSWARGNQATFFDRQIVSCAPEELDLT
jgi:hypothetical protein